jgi:hyperosmotically inducible protein
MPARNELPVLGATVAVLAMLLAGCNKAPEVVVPPVSSTPATINVADADVTSNVRNGLQKSEALKGYAIDVDTLKGDVRLIGVLDRQSQIDDALRIARAADGAHSIHDELTLKP